MVEEEKQKKSVDAASLELIDKACADKVSPRDDD